MDVYSTIAPSFNVVDAIVAMEGDGPNLPPGKPKPLGLFLAGRNGVAVDAVATAIMGVDARQVKHVAISERRGLGTADLAKIDVRGERIEDVRSPFELPNVRD